MPSTKHSSTGLHRRPDRSASSAGHRISTADGHGSSQRQFRLPPYPEARRAESGERQSAARPLGKPLCALPWPTAARTRRLSLQI